MANDGAVLVLIGGIALAATYFYLQKKDEEEAAPEPAPAETGGGGGGGGGGQVAVFGDEGWSESKDREWAKQGKLREEFETWTNDYNGEVVQAIEQARELIREIARTVQNVWPLQEPLTGRIGRMQDVLVKVLTQFRGKAGSLAKAIDAYPDQFLQSQNYKVLQQMSAALSAALDKNAADLNRIMASSKIVNNYQNIVTNHVANVANIRRERGRFIQDKNQLMPNRPDGMPEDALVLPPPSFTAIEGNPRPAPKDKPEAIMLPAPPPQANRDMEVDVAASVAQQVAQPNGLAPVPTPALTAPVSSAPKIDEEDPSFAAAEPPTKRRKHKRGSELADRRGAGPELKPDRPAGIPEDAVIHQAPDLFNAAPRPDIQPPQAQEMGKRKRNQPEFNQAGVEEEEPKVVALVANVYIERLNAMYQTLDRLNREQGQRSMIKAQALAIRACRPTGGENGTVTKRDGTQEPITSRKWYIKYGQIEAGQYKGYVSPEMRRYIEVMADAKRIMGEHRLKF